MKKATTILRRASVASLALLALAAASCRGGSGGPTAPRAVYRLRIIAAIQNQETASTILHAKLFLDGALVADSPSPGESGLASLDGSGSPSPRGEKIWGIGNTGG